MGNQMSPESPSGAGMTRPQSGPNLDTEPRPINGSGQSDSNNPVVRMPASYQKFTDQKALGEYLLDRYHIRSANQLSSCETCHR